MTTEMQVFGWAQQLNYVCSISICAFTSSQYLSVEKDGGLAVAGKWDYAAHSTIYKHKKKSSKQ